MPMMSRPLPDPASLAASLAAVLNGRDQAPRAVTLLGRESCPFASTYPCEVVTCQLAGGPPLRLFCKHAAGMNHNAHGHRGGVGYEAAVYREVLVPLGVKVPRFYGEYYDGSSDGSLLVLEYLDDNLRINKSGDPSAMGKAARWLGTLHAAAQARVGSDQDVCPLNVYDAAYYSGWARRTSEFAGAWHDRFPWLSALCDRAGEALAPLLAAPQTVVHGEYYPRNILYHRGEVYPVDWESAAVAAGEIDLVALTEDWPDEVDRACEAEYRRVRWPGGPPAGADGTAAAARFYLLLRWLGDRPEWTSKESTLRSFEKLRTAGERAGLL